MRVLLLPGIALALAASCASPSSPPSSSQPTPPAVPPAGQADPVELAVTIDARDSRGAPRLLRAVAPRPAQPGGTPDRAARAHLAALAPLWLAGQQPPQLTTRGIQRLGNGATVVRLDQQIDNVVIHGGELRVLLHPDGALAAVAGTLRAGAASPVFHATAPAAVERALDALFGPSRARPGLRDAGERAGYHELRVPAAPELSVGSARARPELWPDGERLIPIWSVELIAARAGASYTVARRYLIGDADGHVVREVDLTASDAFLYRVLADATGDRNPLDGALGSYGPHPTGVPDGSLPALASDALVVMEAFNGPVDPWLAPTATTTTGNNVDAFADITAPEGFNDGDIRPVVRGGRALDYHYDLAAQPLATTAQSMAAAVNVFFVTNWLHDWYYDSGFTEATGNAQLDNYGRGGADGDPLIVHAQAGAAVGVRDNANMTVPDDGASPVMNMFVWSGLVETRLTTPAATPATAGFDRGSTRFDLTGSLVLVAGAAGAAHDACAEVDPAVAGKIALIEYTGDCAPATSVHNAQAAGAIGAVMMIAFPGAAAEPLDAGGAEIPALVVGYDDGLALEAEVPATVTLHRTTALDRDGDLDNAIVSHEWGHYLHLRLASCEAPQCLAMSEGWGDFTALHMMLRPADDRGGTFGLGLYALTAGGISTLGYTDPGYFGIRRFPYSIDRTRNALSFRHIADDSALPDTPMNPGPSVYPNSEPHNAGEIWATMLWEAYNLLIDQHGYREARRRMSDYVVAGLLLTPPDATFTEGRDAILAAAGAIDGDDMLLFAAAFAGRGAGSCAVSPPASSGDFVGVVESGTIAARLEVSRPRLTDDAVSCDHDGYLDPGETGMLRVTVGNTGVVAGEAVVVTATTTTPGVTLGAPVAVGLLAASSQADIAIPVTLDATAPVRGGLDIALHVDGAAGCNTRHLAVELHQQVGVDEMPAVATSDGFETQIASWTLAGDGAEALWSRASQAGNHVMLGSDAGFTSDTQLVSPVMRVSATEPLVVTARHAYALEASFALDRFFDGGVVEVSSDGGATWRDASELGADPRYPATILDGIASPLAGRPAFSGRNPSYPERDLLTLDFGTRLAGQAVQLRFRIGTDACCSAAGWELDDIVVTGTVDPPFPGFVAEPTVCSANGAAGVADTSGVVAVRHVAHEHRRGSEIIGSLTPP